MKENNFFKKSLKILSVAAITASPSQNKETVLPRVDTESIKKEVIVNPGSDTSKIDTHTNYIIEKERLDTSILSQERIESTVKLLQKSVVEQIPKNIKEHYESEYSYGREINSHDHEILALGGNKDFNVDKYMQLLGKTGDSLYYKKSPKVSFENYILESGRDRKMLSENQLKKMESYYDEYIKDVHPLTREYHIASTAYALLRSGAYDTWSKEKSDKAALMQEILEDINDPRHYIYEKTTGDSIPVIRSAGLAGKNEAEWITTTWLELEKRGIKMNFNRGREDVKPFTLTELNNINQKRLDFTLDTANTLDHISGKFKKQEEYGIETSRAACGGAHTLDALTMYDVYTKDSVKLNEHLQIATNKLASAIKESILLNDTSTKEEYSEVLHNLAHWLLPFTELPDTFSLDQGQKNIAQEALRKMIEYSEITQKKFGNTIGVSDLSHVIDILNHLPASVLEK